MSDLRAQLLAMSAEDLVDIVLDQRETILARDTTITLLDSKVRELNAQFWQSIANTNRAIELNGKLLQRLADLSMPPPGPNP